MSKECAPAPKGDPGLSFDINIPVDASAARTTWRSREVWSSMEDLRYPSTRASRYGRFTPWLTRDGCRRSVAAPRSARRSRSWTNGGGRVRQKPADLSSGELRCRGIPGLAHTRPSGPSQAEQHSAECPGCWPQIVTAVQRRRGSVVARRKPIGSRHPRGLPDRQTCSGMLPRGSARARRGLHGISEGWRQGVLDFRPERRGLAGTPLFASSASFFQGAQSSTRNFGPSHTVLGGLLTPGKGCASCTT